MKQNALKTADTSVFLPSELPDLREQVAALVGIDDPARIESVFGHLVKSYSALAGTEICSGGGVLLRTSCRAPSGRRICLEVTASEMVLSFKVGECVVGESPLS